MTAPRYRIKVDHELCQGSGVCAGVAPQFFELGPDHLSRPLREEIDEPDEAVLDASECCPMEAITVTALSTRKPVV